MDWRLIVPKAISEGHGDTAVVLLKAGAETDKRDVDGNLAIDLAPDKKVNIDPATAFSTCINDHNRYGNSYCTVQREKAWILKNRSSYPHLEQGTLVSAKTSTHSNAEDISPVTIPTRSPEQITA